MSRGKDQNDLFLEQAEGYVKALEKSTCPLSTRKKVFEHGVQTNAAFLWLRFWLRFGSGFGDDQGYVSVVNDHSGRKEMLHDFNGIVSIGLSRPSSVATA